MVSRAEPNVTSQLCLLFSYWAKWVHSALLILCLGRVLRTAPPGRLDSATHLTLHSTYPHLRSWVYTVVLLAPASKDLSLVDESHSAQVRSAGKAWLPSFLQMGKPKGSDSVKVIPLLSDRPGSYNPVLRLKVQSLFRNNRASLVFQQTMYCVKCQEWS